MQGCHFQRTTSFPSIYATQHLKYVYSAHILDLPVQCMNNPISYWKKEASLMLS